MFSDIFYLKASRAHSRAVRLEDRVNDDEMVVIGDMIRPGSSVQTYVRLGVKSLMKSQPGGSVYSQPVMESMLE